MVRIVYELGVARHTVTVESAQRLFRILLLVEFYFVTALMNTGQIAQKRSILLQYFNQTFLFTGR